MSAVKDPVSALVADIGGTWVRFALACRTSRPAPALLAERRLAVAEHPSLVAAASHYLACLGGEFQAPTDAVFAIAGRVEGDAAAMTNHPWRIAAPECAEALALRRVRLLNDFAAQALALPHLARADRVVLGGHEATVPASGDWTLAVLGPGTGLGVSALLSRSGRQSALASEGGHAAFAPKNARQRAVLEQLATRFPRVSYERVVSGSGLSNLHWALARQAGIDTPPVLPSEQVTAMARAADPTALQAVEVFCEIFGAFAGDLVLTFGAWDGVYLSGGLVAPLLDDLRRGGFRVAFEAKGRFAAAMARVPVYAVVHPQPGLLGAAALALDAGAALRA
jgi:glucokinase